MGLNRHLEWIKSKIEELDKVNDPIDVLLNVDSHVKSLSQGEVADIIMYLLGEIHRLKE